MLQRNYLGQLIRGPTGSELQAGPADTRCNCCPAITLAFSGITGYGPYTALGSCPCPGTGFGFACEYEFSFHDGTITVYPEQGYTNILPSFVTVTWRSPGGGSVLCTNTYDALVTVDLSHQFVDGIGIKATLCRSGGGVDFFLDGALLFYGITTTTDADQTIPNDDTDFVNFTDGVGFPGCEHGIDNLQCKFGLGGSVAFSSSSYPICVTLCGGDVPTCGGSGSGSGSGSGPACLVDGAACSVDADCCSGVCTGGFCGPPAPCACPDPDTFPTALAFDSDQFGNCFRGPAAPPDLGIVALTGNCAGGWTYFISGDGGLPEAISLTLDTLTCTWILQVSITGPSSTSTLTYNKSNGDTPFGIYSLTTAPCGTSPATVAV